MPPKIYLVRHAQGEHNATRNYAIPDPPLTAKGKGQCHDLQTKFQYHDTIDLVLASPLKRTIQTAALSFGPTLARPEVPFVLEPRLQEVSSSGCDVGTSLPELKAAIPEIFADDDLPFDLSKINYDAVHEGWNNKEGKYAYEKQALRNRAQDLRNWLFQRPENTILLVTHGAFAHFLTEDCDGADPMIGTAYINCEMRYFEFTPESKAEDAHFTETAESRASRGAQLKLKDEDPHIVEELKAVETYN
ncbi:PGAM-domain-containing protein [Corynespora cassiicola Philippines]|uniref:PGAM-domain-containing protein n=1 Tax=Corynespora cassiicola Philippines TaxID=1448308 RepID=A0A2T2P7F0_CORCC|nr:PGAM-domain-containing protein [Corynespora cassiicola Philippines]